MDSSYKDKILKQRKDLIKDRFDRAKAYIETWKKYPIVGYGFSEQAGLDESQKRNLAIILTKTADYLSKLDAETLKRTYLSQEEFLKEVYSKYIELISANMNVIGIETSRSQLFSSDYLYDSDVLSYPCSYDMNDFIKVIDDLSKTKEGLIPYICIHCFVFKNQVIPRQDPLLPVAYGDIVWLPWKAIS